jgi:serine/threonine protein kinase
LHLNDLDIGEILGSGTTGTVKLAVHIPTGMRVAVKIISKRKFFLDKQLQVMHTVATMFLLLLLHDASPFRVCLPRCICLTLAGWPGGHSKRDQDAATS